MMVVQIVINLRAVLKFEFHEIDSRLVHRKVRVD